MEQLLEEQPPDVRVEVVHGVWCMSPRPRAFHQVVARRLSSALDAAVGDGTAEGSAEWLLLAEPEIRGENAFSRLIPDLAGWSRNGNGWPPSEPNPIEHVPDWVAEILSPTTAAIDRDQKKIAYGQMGVRWYWIVDPDAATLEVFENALGTMKPRGRFEGFGAKGFSPFDGVPLTASRLFRPLD